MRRYIQKCPVAQYNELKYKTCNKTMKSKIQCIGLIMLKCKSKIAGLETSLESVFGLDRS